MKTTKKITRILTAGTFILALLFNNAQAQEGSDSLKVIPFQITLISPLGTNGLNSGNVINNASFNIFAGISGGVRGAEVGGLANFSKGDIKGLQFAGIANGSLGKIEGAQISGIANYNKGPITGTQFAGIANLSTSSVEGLQMSGIANVATQPVVGVQFAGIVNTTMGEVKGLQFSGIAGVTTRSMTGVQFSGIVNTVVGTATGAQIAGIANVATEKISGAQIGLINYSHTVRGLQFGLINISDTIEKGVPVGLISFVRTGYHKFEVEANETFYANVTFKSGIPAFYVLYTAGFKTDAGKTYWAPGIGIGSITRISQRVDLNTDLIVRQVNEDEWWTSELNLLNTLRVNASYNFSDKFSVYGGPSFNVTASQITNIEGDVIGDSFAPSWNFYDETKNGTNVKMYIGFNAGIRF